ncbi:MAG: hypothetical protein HZB16_21045 [Armatimonadetes bacterium]|nr:hypothetical protein [Armatimonadota bacterium]
MTLAVCLVAAPIFAGNTLYYGDITVQFVPWRTFARQHLLAGHLPLWLDGLFAGMPFVGNCQSAVFYPFHWLTLPLAPATTIAVGYLLHLWLGVAGGYLLGRRLGHRRAAAVLLGLVYGLSGYVVSKQQFPSLAYTIAWLPWLLYAGARLWREPGARSMLVLAGITGLQWLTGHAQMSFLQLCLLAAWLLFQRGSGSAARRWGLAWAGVLLGTALGAVQIAPTLELLSLSQRTSFSFHDVARFYLPPWQLLMTLSPQLYGAPHAWLPYLGFGPYWEGLWYVGLPTLPLAAAATARHGGRWFWLLVGALGLILALGPGTPVYGWLYQVVPPVRLFRDPARFTLYTVVALSLLAAAGLDGDARVARAWALGLLVVLAAMLLTVSLASAGTIKGWLLGVIEIQPLKRLDQVDAVARAWQGWMTLVLLQAVAWCGATVLVLRWPAQRRRPALVVLIGLDLVFHAAPVNPTAPAAGFARDVRPAEVRNLTGPIAFAESGESSYTVFHNYARVPKPDIEGSRRTLMPDVTIGTSTRQITGYDPLAPAAAYRWMGAQMARHWPARPAALAAVGVVGEWTGRRLLPYPNVAPEVRLAGTHEAVANGWTTSQRRWLTIAAGAAAEVDVLQTRLPGWRATGAAFGPSPEPVTTRLRVPPADAARQVRLTYAPTSFAVGCFASLLAMALFAAAATASWGCRDNGPVPGRPPVV